MPSSAGLLDAFRVESQTLLRLAADADPGRAIPACPGMTVGDLVLHVGTIFHVVSEWVSDGRRPAGNPAPPAGEDVLGWTRDGADALGGLLADLDPTAPCATWSATDRTVGFWIRRMAHETAVHRVDVAQALELPWSIDPALADDGVDEVMELWLGTQLGSAVQGTGRVVRVGERWSVRLLGTLVDYPLPGGPADAIVDGEPAAVWAWAWGRSDAEHPVGVTGAVDAVDAVAEVRAALARAQQ